MTPIQYLVQKKAANAQQLETVRSLLSPCLMLPPSDPRDLMNKLATSTELTLELKNFIDWSEATAFAKDLGGIMNKLGDTFDLMFKTSTT